MTDEETALLIAELQQEAQIAAERRIMAAHDSLDEDDPDVELAGAYCGCLTCDVREVLDAAWPALYRLAHTPGVTPP